MLRFERAFLKDTSALSELKLVLEGKKDESRFSSLFQCRLTQFELHPLNLCHVFCPLQLRPQQQLHGQSILAHIQPEAPQRKHRQGEATKSESGFVLRADIDPVTIRTLSAPEWYCAGLF